MRSRKQHERLTKTDQILTLPLKALVFRLLKEPWHDVFHEYGRIVHFETLPVGEPRDDSFETLFLGQVEHRMKLPWEGLCFQCVHVRGCHSTLYGSCRLEEMCIVTKCGSKIRIMVLLSAEKRCGINGWKSPEIVITEIAKKHAKLQNSIGSISSLMLQSVLTLRICHLDRFVLFPLPTEHYI